MIIAIPTRNNHVDDHFGHCDFYTLFTIDDNKNIVKTYRLDSPEGCGCKSGIASILQELGVKLMLAGNMGTGAKNVLEQNNIEVIRGCSGDINELIQSYLQGTISDSGEGCSSHGENHVCSHNHA
ncbi:MAG: NifB/NifX family molybdenum-iron cluster-binding protein [Bacteroides sp.]|nr:NifB/NifX family molybdenum-iron cluster-binding protein [Bacteroides sp.]